MKKLRPVFLLFLLLLMLSPASAAEGMSACSIPDTVAGQHRITRLSDDTGAVFDYEVPADGVTMLLLYSSSCMYSARVLQELSTSSILSTPGIHVTAVDCSVNDSRIAHEFVAENLGDAAQSVDLWMDGYDMMWSYVDCVTGENSLSFPMVMLIDETKTVRFVSTGYQPNAVFTSALSILLNAELPDPPPASATFSYSVDNGCAVITDVTNYPADLVIPAVLDGYPVSTIGHNAIQYKSGLETVIISEGISRLNSQVFRGCKDLRRVEFPSSITYIYDNVFFGCENLESIEVAPGSTYLKSIDGVLFVDGGRTLLSYPNGRKGTHYTVPEGTTTIGPSALAECTLTDLTLPASLESFYKYSMFQCMYLQNFHVAPDSPYLTAQDGILYTRDMSTCLACPSGREGAITVADGVTALSDYAFQNCGYMTSLTMPDTVTSIGALCFEQCLDLNRIDLSSNLTEIGYGAFTYCYSLPMLILPASLEVIGSSAFHQTGLSEYFFLGDAPELLGINLPFSSSAAFYRLPQSSGWDEGMWSSLSFLNWDGAQLPELSGTAYYSYDTQDPWRLDRDTQTLYFNGDTLKAPAQYQYDSWKLYLGWVRNIITENNVTSLGSACLSQYDRLDNLYISSTVDIITDTAFNSCPPIGTITAAPGSSRFYSQDGMLLTEDHYLLYAGAMEGLTSYTVPSHVRGIGYFAFLNTKLESLTLPAALDSSFSGLRLPTLKHISIPDSRRYTITDDVLYTQQNSQVVFCPNGKTGTLTLPDTVRSIAIYAFQYSSLSEVIIPDSCSFITKNAFYGAALERVHIPGSVAYIGVSAFSACPALREVVIEDGLTTMEYQVFRDCTALERVSLPDSLTSMGRAVFYDCTALQDVDLGDGLTMLPAYTFENCSSLTSITLPLPMIEIEDGAFQNCDNLRSIYAPGTSPAATSYAFRDCSTLPTVYHTPGHPGWQFPLGDWVGCPLEDWTLPERADAAMTDEGLVLEFYGVGAPAPVFVAFYNENGRMVSLRSIPMEHGVLDPIPLPRGTQRAKAFFLSADCSPLLDLST